MKKKITKTFLFKFRKEYKLLKYWNKKNKNKNKK